LAGLETGNTRPGYNLARICIDYAVEARARQIDAQGGIAQGQEAIVAGEGTGVPETGDDTEEGA